MMKPGLYIVGTPIGNLEDITSRALETLRNVNFILAEDTRRTRILLDRFSIKSRLISCYRFNEYSRIPFVLEKIRAGQAIAFVTNAGMPGVADPGALIVRAGRQNGIYLTVIPGPSSVSAAVALSGFGGGGFVFEGFLPRKKGARLRRLTRLQSITMPVVIFEAPHRCLQFLEEVKEIFQDREIFMGRELTKLNEECRWGTAAEINRLISERSGKTASRPVRGELTFVIAPASKKEKHNVDGPAAEDKPLKVKLPAASRGASFVFAELRRSHPPSPKAMAGSPCHLSPWQPTPPKQSLPGRARAGWLRRPGANGVLPTPP